jgi:hypothetical protein
MLFEEILAGQRFRYKEYEYLKIPEIKKTCCQIHANAIRLRDNKETLFEYKAQVEAVIDDQQ